MVSWKVLLYSSPSLSLFNVPHLEGHSHYLTCTPLLLTRQLSHALRRWPYKRETTVLWNFPITNNRLWYLQLYTVLWNFPITNNRLWYLQLHTVLWNFLITNNRLWYLQLYTESKKYTSKILENTFCLFSTSVCFITILRISDTN